MSLGLYSGGTINITYAGQETLLIYPVKPIDVYFPQMEEFHHYLKELNSKSPLEFVDYFGGGYITHPLIHNFHFVHNAASANKLKELYEHLYDEFLAQKKRIKEILETGDHKLELTF